MAVTGDKSPAGALPYTFFNAVVFVPFRAARSRGRTENHERDERNETAEQRKRNDRRRACAVVSSSGFSEYQLAAECLARGNARGTVNFARAGEHVTIQD